MKKSLSALILSAIGASSFGQVIPSQYENKIGGTWYSIFGGTYTFNVSASLLSEFVGQDINGLQFRYKILMGTTMPPTWPPVDTTFSTFDISIGQGYAPSSGNAGFDGSSQVVRSGALSLAANSYVATMTPDVWTPTISFDTPYHYTGGDLAFQITSGSLSNGVTGITLDTVDWSAPDQAYGTDYIARSNYPTSNTVAPLVITRLSTVPEPALMATLGLGALALLRRRKA